MPPKDECKLNFADAVVYVDGICLGQGRDAGSTSLPLPLLGDDVQEMIIPAHMSKSDFLRTAKRLENGLRKWTGYANSCTFACTQRVIELKRSAERTS